MVKAEFTPDFYIKNGLWRRIYSPEELAAINGKLSELFTGTPADELNTSPKGSEDNIRERNKPTVKIRLNSDNKTVKVLKLMSGEI